MKNKTESQVKKSSCAIDDRKHNILNGKRKPHLVRLVFAIAGLGVALTATHGAFYPTDDTLSASEFSAKVHSDLHTHMDSGVPSDSIVADARSLRMLKGIMRSTS